MAARIIDGKVIASELRGRVADEVARVQRAHGVTPGLAVVLVGSDPASQVYVRSKHKQTQAAGMASFEHVLPADVAQIEVLALIGQLNRDSSVHGILVQLPLPKQINPDAIIEARAEFYDASSSARLLAPEPDLVIDAIGNLTAKMHLIATCVRERLRLVSTMGAAARLDPTRIRVADLAATRTCPFARDLRKSLRKKHGLDCTQPTGVLAVYSEEEPLAPQALAYDHDGFECVCPGGTNGKNDCDHKNRVEGSVAFVPSVFGMTAAATAIDVLLDRRVLAPRPRVAVAPRRPSRGRPPAPTVVDDPVAAEP